MNAMANVIANTGARDKTGSGYGGKFVPEGGTSIAPSGAAKGLGAMQKSHIHSKLKNLISSQNRQQYWSMIEFNFILNANYVLGIGSALCLKTALKTVCNRICNCAFNEA